MGQQTRIESSIESSINVASGYILSYLVWMFVVPVLYPQHAAPASDSVGIVFIFTFFSWVRTYFWRRFFSTKIHRLVETKVVDTIYSPGFQLIMRVF